MHDKVLKMIRETLLHENSVEQFTFDFHRSVAHLDLSQPREDGDYPDHSLRLTFTGVTAFSGVATVAANGTELLGVECRPDSNGYHATVTVGVAGKTTKTVRLIFSDMSYERE
jgi:hypothetical protein